MHIKRTADGVKDVARLLGALRHPARLRLARLLGREPLCVCELVDTLRIPQYKVSRHLKALRDVGLVEARRHGRWMYYSIRRGTGFNGFYQDLLKVIDVHLHGKPEVSRDDARLSRRLAMREAGRCVVGKTCC